MLVGVVLATAIPLLAFRFFAPNEAFPVSYRRRKAAHLDIDDRRADAIRSAVSDQLGLRVLDMGPIGLAGSGGSTPLRLRLDDGRAVFGKLYAKTHVRADRWYKTFRTILYGRLEDEAPFQSVRRLAQQEDYTLRVMRDAGVPTAAPVGIVELTPEREYLVVTEFFEGSRRSPRPRSTTTSSTRAWRWSGGCGMPGSPIATSSPPTCSCVTGSCC